MTTTLPPVSASDRAQRIQNASNLAMLARQAIGRGDSSMSIKASLLADLCAEYIAMAKSTVGEEDKVALQMEVDRLNERMTQMTEAVDRKLGEAAPIGSEGQTVSSSLLEEITGTVQSMLDYLHGLAEASTVPGEVSTGSVEGDTSAEE